MLDSAVDGMGRYLGGKKLGRERLEGQHAQEDPGGSSAFCTAVEGIP